MWCHTFTRTNVTKHFSRDLWRLRKFFNITNSMFCSFIYFNKKDQRNRGGYIKVTNPSASMWPFQIFYSFFLSSESTVQTQCFKKLFPTAFCTFLRGVIYPPSQHIWLTRSTRLFVDFKLDGLGRGLSSHPCHAMFVFFLILQNT